MRLGRKIRPERIARPLYERAILKSLQDSGGQADIDLVYASVQRLLAEDLRRHPQDLECYGSTGESIWRNQVRQAVRNLKARNQVQSRHRAVWCIAPAGGERLRKFEETGIDPDDPRDFELETVPV